MTRLSDADAASFRLVGSGQVSDAMEALGLRRTVITGFRPLAPLGSPAVGTAVTLRQAAKHASEDRAARLVRHGELVTDTAGEGDFIVIDVGGRLDVASWGENHSRHALARGVAGALVNGASRDLAPIRAMGFPLFHLGGSPVKGQWDLETVEVNRPVTIGGVQIRPGDIMFGDEDGLLVIPPGNAGAVLEKALAVRRRERERSGD